MGRYKLVVSLFYIHVRLEMCSAIQLKVCNFLFRIKFSVSSVNVLYSRDNAI